MSEVRFPVPAFYWFLGSGVFLIILAGTMGIWLGLAIGRAEQFVVNASWMLERGERAAVEADSAVMDVLEEVRP